MITSEQFSQYTVVSLRNVRRLDVTFGFRVKTEIKALIHEDSPHLIVDMSGVQFIDSTGFSVLISLLRGVKKHKGTLQICGLSPELYRHFELLQLHRVFDIQADRAACAAALAAAAS